MSELVEKLTPVNFDTATRTAPPEPPAVSATEPPAAAASTPPAVTSEAPKLNIIQKLMRAIDQALADDPTRTGWSLTCYMILRSVGGEKKIAHSDDIAKLASLEKEFQTLETWINSRSRDHAIADFEAHQKAVAKTFHDASVDSTASKTLKDFEDDLANKIAAARLDQRRIYLEAQPVCELIGSRFVELATKRADAREAGEREEHDFYGATYGGPSNLVRHFRAAIKIAEARIKFTEFGGIPPSAMVPYLNLK